MSPSASPKRRAPAAAQIPRACNQNANHALLLATSKPCRHTDATIRALQLRLTKARQNTDHARRHESDGCSICVTNTNRGATNGRNGSARKQKSVRGESRGQSLNRIVKSAGVLRASRTHPWCRADSPHREHTRGRLPPGCQRPSTLTHATDS